MGFHFTRGFEQQEEVFHAGAHLPGRGIAGIGHCRADLLAQAVLIFENVDVVFFAQALAHLALGVGSRAHLEHFGEQRLGQDEILLPNLVVEALSDVARQLQVLLLIFADGHVIGPINQDIGSLQHGVVKQACGNETLAAILLALDAFILKLRHAREQAVGGETVENPAQLGMFRHERLDEEVFRLDANGQEVEHQIPTAFG